MSTKSWVCAQGWPKAECFWWELEWLAASGEEVAIVTKNVELDFLVSSLCSETLWGLEREGGGRGKKVGLSRPCRGNLEALTSHSNKSLFYVIIKREIEVDLRLIYSIHSATLENSDYYICLADTQVPIQR